jgi:hydrogenase/urease accessory protein HupE
MENGSRRSLLGLRGLCALLCAVVVSLVTLRADAHAIGLSSGEYTAKGNALTGKLVFARGEVAALAPALDADRDGHISASEVENAKTLLQTKVLERVVVKSGGASCAPAITDAALTEQDGLIVSGKWECADAAKGFDVEILLFDDLARGHRHIARVVSGAATRDEVLYGDARTFQVAADGAPAPGPEAKAARNHSAFGFLKMGIEHILTGYDHLLFLLGLVLARARVRSLLAVVTAFTAAHSITLAVATLGLWSPPSSIVEPAIALSIAYVGIENFFVKDATKRWRITFPFGLIHGFGFASALRELDLPKGDVPVALVTFNLGVELGQLLVMAVVLPGIFFFRWLVEKYAPKSTVERITVGVVSAGVAVAGAIWFVLRVKNGG